MNNKRIIFYEECPPSSDLIGVIDIDDFCFGYKETIEAMMQGKEEIHTLQLALMCYPVISAFGYEPYFYRNKVRHKIETHGKGGKLIYNNYYDMLSAYRQDTLV